MRTFAPAAATGAAPTTDGSSAEGPSPAWGIRRAARLAFPQPAALAGDPVHTRRLRRYLADLLHPYGREPDPDALGPEAVSCDGQSYGEMAETLIDAIVPPGETVDLLVLAHSIPDITPGRATTTYLSHVCPGTPMAFAVSDQGAAGAFTALRLVDAYARSGGLRRALLLVVEQDSLPYHPGVPVPEVAASRGVALLFGEPLPGERAARVSRVGTHVLHPDAPGAALAAELGALGGGPEPVTAVLGGVSTVDAAHPRPADLRFADAGQPGTGVWWELAGELAGPPAGPRRLLLADHDPGLRHLSLATVDLDGADEVPR
ncbi:hypothetical protein ACFRKE_00320 [Kitasatospora indigofera]|uniref:hypothetical protein n=1 Tax=Kitasatospora indigofera TaxID=67307 RepID=UPI00369EE4E4